MQAFFQTLSEKERRRYAAVEADKLGHGGIEYIVALFGIDAKTIRHGLQDLNDAQTLSQVGQRKKGAGRKNKLEQYPELENIFLDVLREHTAGSPQDDAIRWTDLRPREIAERITAAGIPVSRRLVRKLMAKHKYKLRSGSVN